MRTQTVIYPGTFDPITNGHVDLVAPLAEDVLDQLLIRLVVLNEEDPHALPDL